MFGWLVLMSWAIMLVVVSFFSSMFGFGEFSEIATWLALNIFYAANLFFAISLTYDFMARRRPPTM